MVLAVSYKFPVEVRDELRRASAHARVKQTDILLGALRGILPVLLQDRQPVLLGSEVGLADEFLREAAVAASARRGQPMVAVSFKFPIAVRNRLRKAASCHHLTQTDILLGALRSV